MGWAVTFACRLSPGTKVVAAPVQGGAGGGGGGVVSGGGTGVVSGGGTVTVSTTVTGTGRLTFPPAEAVSAVFPTFRAVTPLCCVLVDGFATVVSADFQAQTVLRAVPARFLGVQVAMPTSP